MSFQTSQMGHSDASAPNSDVEFSLITTIRYDPELKVVCWNDASPWQLFPFHLERLRDSASRIGWDVAYHALSGEDGETLFRSVCIEAVTKHQTTEDDPVAVRVLLDKGGNLSTTTFSYERRLHDPISLWHMNPLTDPIPHPTALFQILLDTEQTLSSVFTCNKTSHRVHYESARRRAGILDRRDQKEVLLFNEHDEVTECSITNVYFWRDESWITPRTRSGCLPGVARRWALEHGHAKEGVIRREDVQDGELVLISNGLYIAQIGRVDLLQRLNYEP
ncbi:aminotransferase class IV-domain-containing protein [Auriculariales sp. MPI-PUGE-AT-0066]|nr:aminotransferase class IV-domain-containing protein [Auriculariales sp. MPI-PUGE-AT-0066]